jgi:hypothetical protein
MVTAQQHREFSLVERSLGELRHLATDRRYGAKEARSALGSTLSVFAKGNRDVATILDSVTEKLEPLAQVGVAHGEGTHVDAPSRRAEVHRDAD